MNDNDDFQEMFSRINREKVDFIFPIWVNLALIKSPKTKPFFFSYDFFDPLSRTYWYYIADQSCILAKNSNKEFQI